MTPIPELDRRTFDERLADLTDPDNLTGTFDRLIIRMIRERVLWEYELDVNQAVGGHPYGPWRWQTPDLGGKPMGLRMVSDG